MIDELVNKGSSQTEIEALRARVAELEGASEELARLKGEQTDSIRMRTIEQEFSRVLLENLSDGVVACDAEGRLVIFNRTAREWHGTDALRVPPEEWSTRFDLFGPDGKTLLEAEQIPLVRALRGENVRDTPITIAAKGQAPRAVLLSGDPLFDSNGRKVGAVVVMHDVTAQRLAEEALNASEAELRALFSAMDDLIIVLDRDGRYLKIAPTNSSNIYRPVPELLGKTIHEILPKPTADIILPLIHEAIDNQRVVTTEWSLNIGDKDVWFQTTFSPLPDGTVFSVGRDITERRQVEEALRQRMRHEEIIRAQALALAEISTPLIPINDEVVVMPLIGVLDSQRAQQVMATLLTGISERRARVAILDITGVSVVDTQVANGLVRAARAAQLLGSQVVLTGIRPEVAQTLVGLGADLSGIVTRGTLQSGIAYAMGASNEKDTRTRLER